MTGSGSASVAASIAAAIVRGFTIVACGTSVGSAATTAAVAGMVSAPAGISSTSHMRHQRQRIAASLISSAQYGQVFIPMLLRREPATAYRRGKARRESNVTIGRGPGRP